jgi:Ni/Co efflux regulator RcnB
MPMSTIAATPPGPPPRGYRWVRNGNDAVLIGITSGIVASVIAGAIR